MGSISMSDMSGIKPCSALSGLSDGRGLDSQGLALGWSVAAPSGRNIRKQFAAQPEPHACSSQCSLASLEVIRALLLTIAISGASVHAAEPEFPREQIEFFEKQIRPVLAAQCWNCHGEKKAESGLRLDSRDVILKGGDRGDAVKLRDGAASLLVHAVRREGELKMPPNGRVSPEQVAAISKWIDLGLPWPRGASGSAQSEAWRTHWAFQPVIKLGVPDIANDSWSQTPVDRFVRNQLFLSGGRQSPGSSKEAGD